MWVSLLISPCTSFDLKHTMKDPTKEVPSRCFACPNSGNSTPCVELYVDSLDHLTRSFISGSAGPKRAEKEGISSILTGATRSKTTVGMLYVCMVQYGSHQPQEAIESLKCGPCKWKSKHLILIHLNLQSHMWLVATTLEHVKRKYKGAHSTSTIHTPSGGKANKNYISQVTVSPRFGMQFGHGKECSRANFEGESEAEGIFLLVSSSLFQNHCGCVQVFFCLKRLPWGRFLALRSLF